MLSQHLSNPPLSLSLDICWKGHLLQTIVKAWCFQSFPAGDNWSEMRKFQGPKCDRKSWCFLGSLQVLVVLFVLVEFLSYGSATRGELFHKKTWNISQIKFHLIQFRSEPVSSGCTLLPFLVLYVAPPPSYGYYCTYNYMSTATSTAKTHHYQH